MALDGIFLNIIKQQLDSTIVDARVDKIHQPGNGEVVIVMRSRTASYKLFISAKPDSARIHLTDESFDNPKTPPMLCMLLRKHLGGARLTEIRQPGLDRTLYLEFIGTNEIGDLTPVTLALEIMGRHSNLILLDSQGKVIDALRRVGEDMSSYRIVLPGSNYIPPPPQDKLVLTECDIDVIVEEISDGSSKMLSKVIQNKLQGFSPLIAREAADYVFHGDDRATDELDDSGRDRLRFYLSGIRDVIKGEKLPCFSALCDESGKPVEFSYTPIRQYGAQYRTVQFDNITELLDEYYATRDRMDRLRQRSGDLFRSLMNIITRTERRVASQKLELAQSIDREHLRVCGDLISSNPGRVEKGMQSVLLENYYADPMSEIEIKLDPALDSVGNAQKYYRRYKKATHAENILTEQIEKGEQEYIYLESVFDSLSRAVNMDELDEIRQELYEGGYLGRVAKRKKEKFKKTRPMEFITGEGLTVVVGKNNRQNDELTHKIAKNGDFWFHAKNIPGSHVILSCDISEPSNKCMEQAAMLAAYHSKAGNSALVPIDYTRVKHVKKIPGAAPGMVTYTNYQTIYITPDKKVVDSLKK